MTMMTSLYQIWRSNNNGWQYEVTLSIYGHISFHWYCAHPINILSLPLFLCAVCFSFFFVFLFFWHIMHFVFVFAFIVNEY